MLTPYTALVAVLLASPALWQAFIEHTVSVQVVLVRLLVALPVASLATLVVRTALRAHPPAPKGEVRGEAASQAPTGEPVPREPAAARRATDRPVPGR